MNPSESKWIQVNPSEALPLPPILLSNFRWPYRYPLCLTLYFRGVFSCIGLCTSYATNRPCRQQLRTEIVEIWSRLIEQLAGNVILFGMSKGIGAQDTNPTRQPNSILWCKVWMHKHKACHPKGTIQQNQDEDDTAAHNADETAGDCRLTCCDSIQGCRSVL